MRSLKFALVMMTFLFPYFLDAKDIPMRQGYRQLKLSELPKNRNGSLATYLYSRASSSHDEYLKKLDRNQELMIETTIDSLKTGRLPMAASIWKRFVKSLNNSSTNFDLNNIVFSLIKKGYMGTMPKLTYRANLYEILREKVAILEVEKEHFKETLKNCENDSNCDYDTKDEIDRTYDLWKRRTAIFEKEMSRAEKRFKDVFDPEGGHASLVKQMAVLFVESAEAITSL